MRQMTEEAVLLREQASGSHQPAAFAEVGVEKITEGTVDPWEFLEADGCDNDNPTQRLKTWEKPGRKIFAWYDVNNIASPLQLVKKARQEEEIQESRVVTSFYVTKKKRRCRVVTSGQFLKKELPGRVDASGTKRTIKTGKLWKCGLPRRKIQNKEVDLIRRHMLRRGTNKVLEPRSVTRS